MRDVSPPPPRAEAAASAPPRTWRRFAKPLLALLGVLVPTAALEATTAAFLRHPASLRAMPGPVLDHVRDVYMQIDRPIVQLRASSARYDPELTYTLRPGEFVFASREFSTHYAVNSQGLRDDEASLHEPAIVVVGDSYAMGWGVEQDEAFPQVVERRTGRRVLNGAIASYGTAREMKLLDRLDLSHATHLVVQYCSNDEPENVELQRTGALVPMPEHVYDRLVAEEDRRQRYWFGRYTARLIERSLGARLAHAASPAETEVDAFLHALAHGSRQRLDGLRVIVVSFSLERRDYDDALEAALRRRTDLPPWIRTMRIVRPLLRQTEDTGFVLDDHWNARGHELLATLVLEAIDAGPVDRGASP